MSMNYFYQAFRFFPRLHTGSTSRLKLVCTWPNFSTIIGNATFIFNNYQFPPPLWILARNLSQNVIFWSLFQVLYSYSGIRPKDCALSALADGEEWTSTHPPGGGPVVSLLSWPLIKCKWFYLFSFLILNCLLTILDFSYKWKKEDRRHSSSYPPRAFKKGNKLTRRVGGGAL